MQEVILESLRADNTTFLVVVHDPLVNNPNQQSWLEFPDEDLARTAFDLMRGRSYGHCVPVLMQRIGQITAPTNAPVAFHEIASASIV